MSVPRMPKIEPKSLTSSGNSGIIKEEKTLVLSTYVNSNEILFERAKKIKPIDGYEDIVIHGDSSGFAINDLYGNVSAYYTPREFAEILNDDPNYHGGAIRLISCEAGKGEVCAAQMLANQLGVDVLAPSDIVSVDFEGNITIGKKNDGRWILFSPQKGRET